MNVHGKRYLAEDNLSVDEREHLLTKQPDMRTWLIFDQAILDAAPKGIDDWDKQKIVEAFNRHPMFKKADTLAELATKAGIDGANLAATVAAYNAAQKSGKDEFGRKHMPLPILGKMFRHLAEQATVPVVCHIDHATTLEECRDGIDHGFTSVMIDGSRLPLEENITLTSEVVALAKKAGVSVEGEVGFVGYDNGTASSMTRPDDAAAFERHTGVDALAISIGNVHLQTEKQAVINFETLAWVAVVRYNGVNCAFRFRYFRHGDD